MTLQDPAGRPRAAPIRIQTTLPTPNPNATKAHKPAPDYTATDDALINSAVANHTPSGAFLATWQQEHGQ